MTGRWQIAGFIAIAAGIAIAVWRVERVARMIDASEPHYETVAAEIEDLRSRVAALERKTVRADRDPKKTSPEKVNRGKTKLPIRAEE